MREVPVGITRGRNALVHLQHANALPRHFLFRQHAQHHPRRVASTHRHDKLPTLFEGGPCVLGNDTSRTPCYCFGIRKYFNLHSTLPAFLLSSEWVVPAPCRRNELCCLGRPPRVWLIFVNWGP